MYLCFSLEFSSSAMFWGFCLKDQDSQILHFLTTPLTPGLWLLILSRLLERQGRAAVSQKETLIFISHAADIWEEHLSEALRATRTLIYSRNCFLRQVALLAKFRTNSSTIKAWGRFWLPALLEEILFALYFEWPSQPPQQEHFLMAHQSVAFIVQNINNYYASTRLKHYFKSSLASEPARKGNYGRKILQLFLWIPSNISHTMSVKCLPSSSSPFCLDILWQGAKAGLDISRNKNGI